MTTAHTPTRASGYLALWRAVPRELGFHILSLPIAIVSFTLTISLFFAGIGTIATFFLGVILAIAALYVSRAFGTVELTRLDWAGRRPIARPVWKQQMPGFWGWLRATLGNGHYWLYLLHTMIVNFIVATVTWTLYIAWLGIALGSLSFGFWGHFLSREDREPDLSLWILDLTGLSVGAPGYYALDVVINLVIGLIFLATLPFVSRGLIIVHELIARGMLAAFTSDALRQQVADVTASRGAAISAEGHSLRRLERDIHDGPQQRLVRLQMDLAAAERQLDSDPEKARGLLTEAMQQSKEALEELRALSRGFAPPILLDRGLIAALESAADRSPVPVKIVDELGSAQIPQEIERNAYFVVSEALANVAKHSGASETTVRVWTDDSPSLMVAVFDNGSGGAVATAGHGLAGLEERLRGLGGTLDVQSPAGGPTSVVANLPLPTLEP
jgi:signal transduction histidine kinase